MIDLNITNCSINLTNFISTCIINTQDPKQTTEAASIPWGGKKPSAYTKLKTAAAKCEGKGAMSVEVGATEPSHVRAEATSSTKKVLKT